MNCSDRSILIKCWAKFAQSVLRHRPRVKLSSSAETRVGDLGDFHLTCWISPSNLPACKLKIARSKLILVFTGKRTAAHSSPQRLSVCPYKDRGLSARVLHGIDNLRGAILNAVPNAEYSAGIDILSNPCTIMGLLSWLFGAGRRPSAGRTYFVHCRRRCIGYLLSATGEQVWPRPACSTLPMITSSSIAFNGTLHSSFHNCSQLRCGNGRQGPVQSNDRSPCDSHNTWCVVRELGYEVTSHTLGKLSLAKLKLRCGACGARFLTQFILVSTTTNFAGRGMQKDGEEGPAGEL